MKTLPAFSVLAVALALWGCKKQAPSAAGGPPGGFAIQAVLADARRQAVSESLSLVGTLAANEMVEIKSETDGTVEKILFEEGADVKAGDLMIQLDESKAAASVAEAEANFTLSRVTHERDQQLFQKQLLSQQEFDQAAAVLQANRASLDLRKRLWRDTHINAPFSGIAGGRVVSPGQVISRNTTLTWLVDLDPVKVEVAVPERFLGQLKMGQVIELKAAAFQGEKFRGELYFIAPQVDPATRTALVKARIPNPTRRLKPGMFANLDLTLKLKDNAVVIPESAVLASGDRTLVYVVGSDDTAQIRPVKLGIRIAGSVEVASGLQAGERIVAEGVQKVRPGGKVRAATAPQTEGMRERGSGGMGKQESGKAGKGESGKDPAEGEVASKQESK
jgi:membrane fusion protein (multidrug efflux system)